jgi:hypothetical protein
MTTPPPLTVDGANWMAHAAPHVDSAQWTAVVAAAGKGDLLGFNRPKILSAVAGRPILEWLLDLLLPLCQTTVFVLSPDGRDEVEPELERLAAGRYRIAIRKSAPPNRLRGTRSFCGATRWRSARRRRKPYCDCIRDRWRPI